MAKTQVKAKQHSEAELLLNEIYSLSSSTLSSKNKRRYSKKWNKWVCFNNILWLMTMKWCWIWNVDHIDATLLDVGLDLETIYKI